MKNWRPITLLNVSYKILSSVIAKRIKSVLPNIIHENQKGFLSGRYIGENTRLLYDVINNCNNKNIPGFILLLDFEKAFDSISWKYINKVLRFFNFGENLIKWITIFCNNFQLCVIQNGFFSKFFKIGRGCRQGDPVSSYIFLLCVEIMGIMIRNDKNIKGITILKHNYKVLQYADDTALLLDGTQYSLKNALSLIGQFSKFSGLKPNYNKTVCIKIGPLRFSDITCCEEYCLNWSQEPFKFLGIHFSVDLSEMVEMNYSKVICKAKNLIKSWSRRQLSTLGRITVIKSLVLPLFTHIFMALPNPNDNLIKEIEKIFFSYIWNNKNEKIARKNIIQNFRKGGLKMISVKSFMNSIKITWIRRIFYNPNSDDIAWINLLNDNLCENLMNFLIFGNEFLKNLESKIDNSFWKDVFRAYYSLRELCEQEFSFFQPLWHNKLIKGNKKIYLLY